MNLVYANPNITLWFILILSITLIVLSILNRKHLIHFCQNISWKTWGILLLLVICSLSLRLMLPQYFHMWTDEASYMEIAKGILQDFSVREYYRTMVWPFILSLMFFIFGMSPTVGFSTSAVMGALTIVNVFLITYALTKRQGPSLMSALLFSLFYSHNYWSGSAESNVAALFFLTASIVVWFMYINNHKPVTFLLALASLGFAVQFRSDNYLFVCLFVMALVIFTKKYIPFERYQIKYLILFAILIAPNLYNNVLFYSTQLEFEIMDEGRALDGFIDFPLSVLDSGLGLFEIVLIVLLLAGIYMVINKFPPTSLFLGLWLLVAYIIGSLFYEAHLTSGCENRLYLNFFPVFSVISAYAYLLYRPKRRILSTILLISVAGLLIVASIEPLKMLRNSPSDMLLQTELPEMLEEDVPDHCLLLATHTELVTCTTDINSMTLGNFFENDLIDLQEDCVYYIEGIYCLYPEDIEHDQCRKMHEYELELVKTYRLEDIVYPLYRVSQ